jgi:hypothetical protein
MVLIVMAGGRGGDLVTVACFVSAVAACLGLGYLFCSSLAPALRAIFLMVLMFTAWVQGRVSGPVVPASLAMALCWGKGGGVVFCLIPALSAILRMVLMFIARLQL